MSAAGASGLYVNPNTGEAQAGLAPFRNAVINGDMRINQRATSTNLASLSTVAAATPGSWVVDRWNVYRSGLAAGGVMAQGTNLTTSDLPFSDSCIKTFVRVGRLSGNAATNGLALQYNIESQDSLRFIGKTITLSFYYRTGANFSDTSIRGSIYTGTGTDQGLRNGFTGQTTAGTATYNSNASWQRVSLTCTIGTNINQIGVSFNYTPSGTAGAADYFDITGVQLELGSVATPFEVRPYPVELQLCQRYYQKSYAYSTSPGTTTQIGAVAGFGTSTNFMWTIFFQTNLRTSPSGGTSLRVYGANSGTIDNYNLGGIATNYAVTYNNANEKSATVYANNNGVVNNYYYIQYVVDVEL